MFLTSAGDAEPYPAAGFSAARPGRLVLITLACTLLPALVTLDATIANVAQRTFAEQFSSTPAAVAWTATGYGLALAAAILITGWSPAGSAQKCSLWELWRCSPGRRCCAPKRPTSRCW